MRVPASPRPSARRRRECRGGDIAEACGRARQVRDTAVTNLENPVSAETSSGELPVTGCMQVEAKTTLRQLGASCCRRRK